MILVSSFLSAEDLEGADRDRCTPTVEGIHHRCDGKDKAGPADSHPSLPNTRDGVGTEGPSLAVHRSPWDTVIAIPWDTVLGNTRSLSLEMCRCRVQRFTGRKTTRSEF